MGSVVIKWFARVVGDVVLLLYFASQNEDYKLKRIADDLAHEFLEIRDKTLRGWNEEVKEWQRKS